MNRRTFCLAAAIGAAQAAWPSLGQSTSPCEFEQHIYQFRRERVRCDYVHDQYQSATLLFAPTSGDAELQHRTADGCELSVGPVATAKSLAASLSPRDLSDWAAPAEAPVLPRLQELQTQAARLVTTATSRGKLLAGSYVLGALLDGGDLNKPLAAVWLVAAYSGIGWIHAENERVAKFELISGADLASLPDLLKGLPSDSEHVIAGQRGVVIACTNRLVWHVASGWQPLEPLLAKTGGAAGRPEFSSSALDNANLPHALQSTSNDPVFLLRRLAGAGPLDLPRQDPVVCLLRG